MTQCGRKLDEYKMLNIVLDILLGPEILIYFQMLYAMTVMKSHCLNIIPVHLEM